ncbi:MAG TPA: FAD-binding oxidoreductase, partial [Flavobacteriaceae bacterium]|nr:FAD-binding oxidoreductase [Flavobacteriaceae bacterium]
MKSSLRNLQNELEGELHTDSLSKAIYATDASVYRELPIGVAYPKNIKDLKKIIHFCTQNRIGVIPRAAGTSLAVQCVGKGIVVDISKYFTEILDFNQAEQTIVVQPGVIRDDLNRQIKSTNLFLGPNTSTSNRAMIGGMVGNNSSGTTSIKYGVTRDKVIELQAILSDGSQVVFKEIGVEEFRKKMNLKTLEGNIYRKIFQQLSSKEAQKTIIQNFPKPEIHRRNTGYAIDKLIDSQIFSSSDKKFNMCELLCGSEGTLAFITQIKLKLDPLPPENRVMVAAHFSDISTCLNAVEPVMQHDLYTCEMMDKTILDCTKNNLKYVKNRFFIQGDPKAILMLEICHEEEEKLQDELNKLLKTLEENTESYSNALISGPEIELVLDLRKAGLGLLGNMVGDKKTVACIEDTAVALQDLANYITDFTKLMDKHQQPA